MKQSISRRTALARFATGTVALTSATRIIPALATETATPAAITLKGNIHHSACRGPYRKIPLDEFCKALKQMGLNAVDLLDPPDFETVRKHGLTCSMVRAPFGGIPNGWNRIESHEKLVPAYEQRIKEIAELGFERMICFSGNRAGLDDEKGLENCAAGLKRVMATAEKHEITLCMELLNSKRSHKDYQCDHSAWGVELCKRVGSERFKLLYDIFHMQIMEGDICDTIRENHRYFGHYHTGGVPGRGEIDETQELNYRRIMQAIVATGFKGYVAQEFSPKRPDALGSLRQAIQICDV